MKSKRLTSLSRGGGCGCKIEPKVLHEILKDTIKMPIPDEVIVGINTSDDAAVYQINENQVLIATTDFFTPIVDDPEHFGEIAATNAISDVYAMGGKPIFALAIVCMPTKILTTEQISKILNGGKKMIKELIKYKKKTKLIGVSMLTSLDQSDLKESGVMCNEISYVEKLVRIGVSSGIDGVVSSPKEVKLLRKKFEELILVTPGIRLPEDSKNDQKRTETPGMAVKNGSSLLIIGRTITKSTNPISSIERIIQNIENEI